MRKMLVLLLAMALLLSLSACGEKEEPASEEKHSSNQADKETKPTQPEETTAPDAPEREFSIGKVTGQNYENTFIGIGCTLPEHWTFSTEQELLEKVGIYGITDREEALVYLEGVPFYYDMSAGFQGDFPTIMIYLKQYNNFALNILKLENHYLQILDYFAKEYALDVKNVTGTVEEVQISGQTVPFLRLRGKQNGMVYYWSIFCIKCDGYLATVEICTMNKSDARDILNCFYFIEA